jgi:hypothetical protein
VIITPLVQARLLQCTSLSLCLSARVYICILFRGRQSTKHRPSTDTTTSPLEREQKQNFPRQSKQHHVHANPTGRGQEQRAIRCVVHFRPSRPTTREEIPCRYALTWSMVNIWKNPNIHPQVTCMDARIDPAAAFGIALGDAHVIRNAGGNAQDALFAASSRDPGDCPDQAHRVWHADIFKRGRESGSARERRGG